MTPTTPANILLFLLLVTGATYRLTVLAIRDTITQPIRTWIDRHFHGRFIDAFTRCPWCVSVWIAAGLTTAAYWWWPWFRWPLIAATAAAITGILSEKV